MIKLRQHLRTMGQHATFISCHPDDSTGQGKGTNRELRMELWLKLLANRPRDTESDEMSAWLMAAVAVSDPDADIANNFAVHRFIDSLEESPEDMASEISPTEVAQGAAAKTSEA